MSTDRNLGSGDMLAAVFDTSPDMVSISSLEEGIYLEVNEAFLTLSGYSREEVIGRTSVDLGLWPDLGARQTFRARVQAEGRIVGFEARLRMKSGEERLFQISAARIEIGGRACIGSVSRDITAQRELARNLEKYRHQLERAEQMASVGSWEFDYPTKTVEATPGAVAVYGAPKSGLAVQDMEEVPLPEYRPLLDRARDEHIRLGIPYDIKFKIKRLDDGQIRDIWSRAEWDAEKKKLFGVIRDITDETAAREKLELALRERETLLRELYHRTENNMQHISSLLGLESARPTPPSIEDLVARVQRRILAMSLVHQKLYESQDLSVIDLGEFLPELAVLLLDASGLRSDRIAFEWRTESLRLLIDTAIPVGIIMNELIANALQWAFPGDRRGTIWVEARREPDGLIVLAVRDDGVGLDSPGRIRDPDGVGLFLVRSLGEGQLGGKIELETEGGLSCTLRFSDQAYLSRL